MSGGAAEVWKVTYRGMFCRDTDDRRLTRTGGPQHIPIPFPTLAKEPILHAAAETATAAVPLPTAALLSWVYYINIPTYECV